MAKGELGFQLSDAKHTDLITCRLPTHHFCSCFCGSPGPLHPLPAWLPSMSGAPLRAGPQGGKLWRSGFPLNMYYHSVLVCSQCDIEGSSSPGPWPFSHLTPLHHHQHLSHPCPTHFPLYYHVSLDIPVCLFACLIYKLPSSFFRLLTQLLLP